MAHTLIKRMDKRNLAQRLAHTRLKHALLAPETLLAESTTALATLFIWLNAAAYALPLWSWVAVVAAGLAATATLVVAGMTDRYAIFDSVTVVLEDYFSIEKIADASIRNQIAQAIAHRARLEEALHGNGRSARAEFSGALGAVDQWLTGMASLANVLGSFHMEAQRHSETKLHLSARIAELECRVVETTDGRVKAQLRETIAGRRHQQRAILELESLVERGLLRLEHAVAALGTINAQFSTLAVRGEQEGGAARLARDVNSEIKEIDAVLAALDRVYVNDPADSNVSMLESLS